MLEEQWSLLMLGMELAVYIHPSVQISLRRIAQILVFFQNLFEDAVNFVKVFV